MGIFWSRIMQRKGALIAGILAGIAAPASIGAPVEYPRPRGSDLSRMRGDVERLGGDFSSVLGREHGKQNQPARKRPATTAKA